MFQFHSDYLYSSDLVICVQLTACTSACIHVVIYLLMIVKPHNFNIPLIESINTNEGLILLIIRDKIILTASYTYFQIIVDDSSCMKVV